MGGVEFTLGEGDTVFHIGPQRDLTDGNVGETIASADNTYYIPDDRIRCALVIRWRSASPDGLTPCRLEWALLDVDNRWVFHPAVANEVFDVTGIYLAWRALDDPWAADVLAYQPPVPNAVRARVPLVARVPRPRSKRVLALALGGGVLALLLGAGYWFQRHYVPETRVRGLVDVVADAPVDYDIAYGKDGRLYAFTDQAAGVAWGQRASERLGRRGDVFVERSHEAVRLGDLMTAAGIEHVVIRLRDPSNPEVVLSGEVIVTESLRRRVRAVLEPAMPYASTIEVESIGDARLLAIARERLRSLGISTQVDMAGPRVSISNDAYLDDAGLHAMTAYVNEFGDRWGRRRVAINIRLWDDLLKGRSYQYSPGQLLSVGQGRWDAFRPVRPNAP
jgi:Type III secretion system protein PrgH-EprH (PrgH)